MWLDPINIRLATDKWKSGPKAIGPTPRSCQRIRRTLPPRRNRKKNQSLNASSIIKRSIKSLSPSHVVLNAMADLDCVINNSKGGRLVSTNLLTPIPAATFLRIDLLANSFHSAANTYNTRLRDITNPAFIGISTLSTPLSSRFLLRQPRFYLGYFAIGRRQKGKSLTV
jgi:hypothetical protein